MKVKSFLFSIDYKIQNVDCWQRTRERYFVKQSLNILYPVNICFFVNTKDPSASQSKCVK